MDLRGHSATRSSGNRAYDQLHELCRHIISHDIVVDDPKLSSVIDKHVKDSLKSSVMLLNKSQSSHEDVTINEFSVAEKIKKYLVSLIEIKHIGGQGFRIIGGF